MSRARRERESTSPGLVGHNFWSYRGRTIAEIVAEYHDATPRRGGIVVNGKQFRFTQGDVAERAKGQVPAQPYVTYGVTVGPVLWPPRELMRVVTGEHLGENPNSQECMAHFEQLGLQTWTRTVYEGNKPEVHATRRRGPNSKS